MSPVEVSIYSAIQPHSGSAQHTLSAEFLHKSKVAHLYNFMFSLPTSSHMDGFILWTNITLKRCYEEQFDYKFLSGTPRSRKTSRYYPRALTFSVLSLKIRVSSFSVHLLTVGGSSCDLKIYFI